jgi:hypothetical protein
MLKSLLLYFWEYVVSLQHKMKYHGRTQIVFNHKKLYGRT